MLIAHTSTPEWRIIGCGRKAEEEEEDDDGDENDDDEEKSTDKTISFASKMSNNRLGGNTIYYCSIAVIDFVAI